MKRNSKHTRWGAVLKWPQGPSQDPSPCAVTRGWGLGWTDTGSPEKYTIICPILAWYFNKGFNKWGTWFCFSNVPTPTSLELHWNVQLLFRLYISAVTQHLPSSALLISVHKLLKLGRLDYQQAPLNRDWRYINLNFWLLTLSSQAQVNKKLERAKVI